MVNKFVEKVSKEERERTQAFLEFAKDPDMAKITNEEKAKAKEENEAYKKQLSGKIVKKDKEVRAKTLMSIAAGLAVAAAVCATVVTIVPVAAPILLPVIISLGISAAVTGFAAERMSPGVTKDLKNSFMHFRKKIKKHKMYAEQMKTLEEEVKAAEVQAPMSAEDKNNVVANQNLQQTINALDKSLTAMENVVASAEKSTIKNDLADYEKKRKPKKEKPLFKISNIAIEDIKPDDMVLISQLAENSRVGWAALGKRIAESKTVKGVFKKLGIEKEYEEFIDVLITAGEKIEEYTTDVSAKALLASQKDAVKEGLTKLTNGIAVKASELAEKVDKIGKKQPMPVSDHIKNAAKLLTAVRQVAHVAQAVTAALHSEENLLNLRHFPYWLERQLVKTRLWQAELELINNSQSGYKVEPSDKKWMEG